MIPDLRKDSVLSINRAGKKVEANGEDGSLMLVLGKRVRCGGCILLVWGFCGVEVMPERC
jgi:hypothetical protein